MGPMSWPGSHIVLTLLIIIFHTYQKQQAFIPFNYSLPPELWEFSRIIKAASAELCPENAEPYPKSGLSRESSA